MYYCESSCIVDKGMRVYEIVIEKRGLTVELRKILAFTH